MRSVHYPCLARQDGQTLLAVLVLTLIIAGSAATFTWFMNQQQTRAGARYRSAAALHAAEAGVYRALAILERDREAPWGARPYAEELRVGPLEGRFSLSVTPEADGARTITSTGEVAGITRTVRVRVYLASPALLAALNGAGIVKLDGPPAAIFLLPYGPGAAGRPWIHVMAGRAVWFAASDVALNSRWVPLRADPGPVDAAGSGEQRVMPSARVGLGRDAILAAGGPDLVADPTQLRAFGVPIEDVITLPGPLPEFPTVDRGYFLSLAAANPQNAAVNRRAGDLSGDESLRHKTGSDYTGAQFLQILAYLASERPTPRLRGLVYVQGLVTIPEGLRVHIEDGALITESTVHLSPSGELSITHTASTRTLPGLITLDLGKLVLAQGARLRAHGLVYVNKAVEVGEGATLDVVGAVLAGDPGISVRAAGAPTVIRYDPAVLGTPGLLLPAYGSAVAWVALWEEVP